MSLIRFQGSNPICFSGAPHRSINSRVTIQGSEFRQYMTDHDSNYNVLNTSYTLLFSDTRLLVHSPSFIDMLAGAAGSLEKTQTLARGCGRAIMYVDYILKQPGESDTEDGHRRRTRWPRKDRIITSELSVLRLHPTSPWSGLILRDNQEHLSVLTCVRHGNWSCWTEMLSFVGASCLTTWRMDHVSMDRRVFFTYPTARTTC